MADRKPIKTDEERKAEKARRMLEKAGRMPLNDVVLQVHDGVIPIQSLFAKIDARLEELKKEEVK